MIRIRTATSRVTGRQYPVLVRPLEPPPLVNQDTGAIIPVSREVAMSQRGWIAEGAGFTAYGDTVEEAVDNHGART